MVIAYLLNTQLDSFSQENILLMDHFVDKLFFSKTKEGKLVINEFEYSRNAYLIEAYKSTFLQDNFVQTLSQFFNQKPADSSPAMYKILLLTLHGHGLSLENRKTLLSEIAEVLPCILR